MTTTDENYKKDAKPDAEIKEKESGDHIVTSSLAIAMMFLFNAYYLLNFYTKPVHVKINVDDIWKLQVLNVVAWVIQMAGNYIVKKSA